MTLAPRLNPPTSRQSLEKRVLVAAPLGRDAQVLCRLLNEGGIETAPCADVAELCRLIDEGAAAAVVAEEALGDAARRALSEVVFRQPEWSDFPLITIAPPGQGNDRGWNLLNELRGAAQVILLQRPVRKVTLLSSVQAAIQMRTRQYQVRDELVRRRQTEQALRESEQRLHLALTAGNTGAWDWDLTSDTATVSDSYRELFGLPAGQRFGYEEWLAAVHPDDRGRCRAYGEAFFGSTDRTEWDLEFRIVTPHMGVRWHRAVGRLVRDADGKPLRFVGVSSDITDVKATRIALERELADSRVLQRVSTQLIRAGDADALYEALVEAATELMETEMGTMQLLLEEQEELKLLASKGVHPQLLAECSKISTDADTSCAEAVRRLERVIVHDYGRDSRFADTAAGRAHMEAGVIAAQSTPLVSRSGRLLGVISTHWTHPHTSDSRRLRLMDILARQAADALERAQSESALRQSRDDLERRVQQRTAELQQRADQLSRLTSELTLTEQRERQRLAKMLHDHLQQLLVSAKMGMDPLTRSADERQTRVVERVKSCIEDAIRASRSLTVELAPPILHEGGLAKGLEWLARWKKQKHGLEVELSLDPRADPQREDVRTLVFESVRELLFNVVKHAGVLAASVQMKVQDEEHLRITVRDRGQGFDPPTVRRREAAGEAGFGLFSIRERLALLGGAFTFEAEPDNGTCFTIVAPRLDARAVAADEPILPAEPEEPRAPGPDADSRRQGPVRLLVVDDHAVMREGLCMLLEEEPGLAVIGEASDGVEALDQARALQPDVVLMDSSMPRMDGVEATRRIREELPHVQVIGLSMYEEQDRASAMLDAGAAAYLNKSRDADALVDHILAVHAALQKQTSEGESAAGGIGVK